MWLEVNKDNVIIGVHSDRCDSDDTWVESDDPNIRPGDEWKKGKVVRVREKTSREDKSVIKETKEIKETKRRRLAHLTITRHYPEWQQLNILREGDQVKITSMGDFIDAVRAWSNTSRAPDKKLQVIENEFFPESAQQNM